MPNLIKRLLDGAAAGHAKSFPFGGGAGSAGGGGAYDLSAIRRDRLYMQSNPGSARNWQNVVGERHLCSVVGVCLNWYIGTIQSAPSYVAQKNGKTADDKVAIDRHPMEMLIRRPNDFYSGSLLWAGTLLDYRTRGNAYWFKVRSGYGKVVNLWWIPAMLVEPVWRNEPGAPFIDGYKYKVPGREDKIIPTEDVIHFKHGLHPGTMGRMGLDPLAPVLRSIGAVNAAENFEASLLMNNATPSLLITPDPSLFRGETAVVDRAALTAMTNPATVKAAIIDKTSGDNVGKPLVWDVPFIIQKLGFSPEELALDKLQAVPIDVVCAAMSLDPMVVGLPSERQTFSNFKEAVQSAWENSVMPMHASFGETLDVQLLPDFDAKDNQSTEWDYSGVPALQEDKNALWTTALEAWKGNGIDRSTYKKMIGQTPKPEDEGLYYADIAPAGSGGFDQGAVGPDGKPLPPVSADSPGKPSGARPATKSSDGGNWVTLANGVHIDLDNPPAGFTGSHMVPAKEIPDKQTRSEIAKASAYTVGADIQRYAEETNEPILAKAVGGVSLRDNEPVDVMVVKGGIVEHGVEMKTMVNNKSGQISMKKEAIARKAAWMAEHKAPLHTVVFDDQKVFNADGPGKHDESKRTIYYRRGFGAFSVSAMHVVPDLASLSELMSMEDKDLPKAAQPPKTYVPPPPRESKSWASTYR